MDFRCLVAMGGFGGNGIPVNGDWDNDEPYVAFK